MNRLILAATIAAISQFSHAVCSYPLDATGTQYGQIAEDPFSTISGQSASSIVTDGFIGGIAMSSANVSDILDSETTGADGGDILLPNSGIVAFEFSVDQFPQGPTNSTGLVALAVGMRSSNGAFNSVPGDGFQIGIMILDSSASNIGPAVAIVAQTRQGSAAEVSATAPAIPVTLPLPAGYRVGLYVNMTTRQVGYTVNGVNYGYMSQDDNGYPFVIPASINRIGLGISGLASVSATDPNMGATIGGTLITDSSQFTQPFPVGTTDICGASMVQAGQVVASSTNTTTNTASTSTSSGAGSADVFSLLLLLLMPVRRLCRRLA